MSDDIQRRLEEARSSGKLLSNELLEDLIHEVRPVVGRFLRVSGEELNEQTEEVVLRLLCPTPEAATRKAASAASGFLLLHDAHIVNSSAFRKTVVVNYLRDEARKRRTRRDYEDGFARGETPEEVKERRRRRKASVRSVEEDTPAATAEAVSDLTPEAAENAALRRIEVARLLSALPNVTQRVAVAVESGIDPTPWADELAQALKEPCGDTLQRLEALRCNEPDAGLALLFPDSRPTEVRERFRKHVERGLKAIRYAMDAQPALAAELRQLLSARSDGAGA